jgi:hypothetical protein
MCLLHFRQENWRHLLMGCVNNVQRAVNEATRTIQPRCENLRKRGRDDQRPAIDAIFYKRVEELSIGRPEPLNPKSNCSQTVQRSFAHVLD